MSKEKTSSSSSGIGFFGLLTIVLIVLKLLGKISLSWWVIAAVFFVPLGILLAILGVVLLVGISVAVIGACLK